MREQNNISTPTLLDDLDAVTAEILDFCLRATDDEINSYLIDARKRHGEASESPDRPPSGETKSGVIGSLPATVTGVRTVREALRAQIGCLTAKVLEANRHGHHKPDDTVSFERDLLFIKRLARMEGRSIGPKAYKSLARCKSPVDRFVEGVLHAGVECSRQSEDDLISTVSMIANGAHRDREERRRWKSPKR